MMKTKVLCFVANALCLIAVVCASTPSRLGMYEPEKPECLK